MKLDYNGFQAYVVDHIKEHLNDSYKDAEISINEVVKPNSQKLQGLSIRRRINGDIERISPNIYLNEYYAKYSDGKSIESILDQIARIRMEHEDYPDVNIADFSNFDAIRDQIHAKLLNRLWNTDYIADKPHSDIAEDLTCVYYIDLGEDDNGLMSVTITDSMMAQWDITLEELHQSAIDNDGKQAYYSTLIDVLMKARPETDFDVVPEVESGLYVLTKESKMFGASLILNEKIMDQIAAKMGSNSINVIPCSQNELLLFNNSCFPVPALNQMIVETNEQHCLPEEVLSNHAYHYDVQTHTLMVA